MHNCRIIINTPKEMAARKIFKKFQTDFLAHCTVRDLQFEGYSADENKIVCEFKIFVPVKVGEIEIECYLSLLTGIASMWNVNLIRNSHDNVSLNSAVCNKTILNAIEWINFEFDC